MATKFLIIKRQCYNQQLQRVTLNKYGRTEYADDKGNIKVYGNDKITNIKNRNYMFYKKEGKLETALRSMVTSYKEVKLR